MGHAVLWTAAVLCVATACGMSNAGREATYGTFVAAGGDSEVEILSRQRMPDSWGGEENVYARYRSGDYESQKLDIDINGRFRDTLRVDLSREGRWARIYLAIDPPVTAETAWVDHGDGSGHYLMPGAADASATPSTPVQTGQPAIYRWSVLAYVDFSTGTVIRWPNAASTPEERRTLLTKFDELPPLQTIRGTRIEWVPTTKR